MYLSKPKFFSNLLLFTAKKKKTTFPEEREHIIKTA